MNFSMYGKTDPQSLLKLYVEGFCQILSCSFSFQTYYSAINPSLHKAKNAIYH
jgi:hypothetical protein